MNDVAFVTQLYDERIRVLSQQLQVIKCVLEHIVVEIVDDVFGHVENGEPDEEWLLHPAHRCVQLDANQILGIHGCSGDHIVHMLLNDGFTSISRASEFYLHPLQSSLHELAIGRICQQLV